MAASRMTWGAERYKGTARKHKHRAAFHRLTMLSPSGPLTLALAVLVLRSRLTAGAAIRQVNVTSLAYADAECSSSGDWVGHQLVAEDCNGAVNKLRNVEVSRHWLEQYEFLGIGAEAVTKYRTMRTPRRYIVRKSLYHFEIGIRGLERWLIE